MGSPLDDAVERAKHKIASDADHQEHQARLAAEARAAEAAVVREFSDLRTDFLSRMEAVGARGLQTVKVEEDKCVRKGIFGGKEWRLHYVDKRVWVGPVGTYPRDGLYWGSHPRLAIGRRGGLYVGYSRESSHGFGTAWKREPKPRSQEALEAWREALGWILATHAAQ